MEQAANTLNERVYFGSLNVLVVESGTLERDILVQVMAGFKAKSVAKYSMTDQAMEHLQHDQTDLLIVGALKGDMDCYAFIRWLRQSTPKAVQTLPVILLTGHTQQSNVIRARDCGASFVVAKPITPQVLFSRVAWLARDTRKFVRSDSYTGPDRRFQALGPPTGIEGRRETDLLPKAGETAPSNMSQAAIDLMMSAKEASP